MTAYSKFHVALAIIVLGIMCLMIVFAIRDMTRGGSLDDLPADEIARRMKQ